MSYFSRSNGPVAHSVILQTGATKEVVAISLRDALVYKKTLAESFPPEICPLLLPLPLAILDQAVTV